MKHLQTTDEPALRTAVIEAMISVGALTAEQGQEYAGSGEDFSFESLVLDSLGVMDFCNAIEAKLGIVVEPSDVLENASYHDLVSLLEKRASNGI